MAKLTPKIKKLWVVKTYGGESTLNNPFFGVILQYSQGDIF